MKYTGLFFSIVLILSLSSPAAVDPTPSGLGNTQTRNATGNSFEAVSNNPALLGVDRAPKGGLLVPLLNISIGEWSDKLALSPFNRYWVQSNKEASALTTKVLKRSFKLDGLSPDEVSRKLEQEFKGGVSIYSGLSTTLLSIAHNRIGFDVVTHFDYESRIPEGPLMIIFGVEDGLKRGNSLDFSDFKQQSVWATDFTFSIGLPVNVPALHKLFRLEYGAGGVGIKYVLGHSVLDAETRKGSIIYNEKTNEVEVDASVQIRTAGTGFSGPWRFDNPFSGRIPVSGHGIGVDIGGILYDEKGQLSVNFKNLGIIFWMKNIREATYEIRDKNVNAYDMVKGVDEAKENNDKTELYIFDHLVNDSLSKSSGFTTLMPLSFNIGYAYTWDFSKTHRSITRVADYLRVATNYEQQLDEGPGRSFIPRFSFGVESGMLSSHLPVRIGHVFGGPERIASAMGFGIKGVHGMFNFSYKAIGTPVWVPKRGVEIAAGYQINWGLTSDTDKDGIDNKNDKCPTVAEDKDGFMDSDGCPDWDNDSDNIPDSLDQCINDAEDIDGFEDSDGCPDWDNDSDNIPDTLDKCIDVAEDKDNFEDDDGCPDWDNDQDGIPDSVDRCPILAEDLDGFEDSDGCPDYDNDKDGIADSVDNCKDIPETFNGYRDDDGCPDTLIKPTENETKVLNTKLRSINFKTGSAELLDISFAALDYIVEFLKQYPHLRYEIQGHTDSQGSDEFNLVLSAARAGTVRGYLLLKGLEEERLIAIGYGESVPIADNVTAGGRAINRRVEFKIIETSQEYEELKSKAAVIREMVRTAKIKGSY